MPLINVNKRALSEEDKREVSLTSKRSRTESKSRQLDESELPATMTDPQKKANFSALSGNGISRHASPLANAKPGASRKLTIKNFKGMKSENVDRSRSQSILQKNHSIYSATDTIQS